MSSRRRVLSALGLGIWVSCVSLAGCGGPGTRLVTVKAGTGEGKVTLEVKNLTDVAINNFFLAKSSEVGAELDSSSPEGEKVWGSDLLSAAIPKGVRVPVPVPEPGRWDAR